MFGILVLAILIVLLGDPDGDLTDVNWLKLFLLSIGVVVCNIVFFAPYDPFLQWVLSVAVLFCGLIFFMQIPPKNSLNIVAGYLVVSFLISLLPL